MALVTETLDCGCVVTITREADGWGPHGYEQCAEHKAAHVQLRLRSTGGFISVAVQEASTNCTLMQSEPLIPLPAISSSYRRRTFQLSVG